MPKIYTCTPVSFEANEHFHIRDTGLIAGTLRSMGVESKCIMPEPAHPGDLDLPLIRTKLENLKDYKWWKNLHIDGVVLYSWGAPKYTAIARAIHKAGLKLMIHMDFGGSLHPSKGSGWFKIIKSPLVNLIRAIHLGYADYITASPCAKESFAKSIFYGKRISEKVRYMPTPVASHFTINNDITKSCRVVCIGRWSDEDIDKIKRPDYLMDVAEILVKMNPDVEIDIYGRTGKGIIKRLQSIPARNRERIRLKGYAHNKDLPKVYSGSQVCICTSYSEGTHIASAEALCCGCSVVVPPTDRHKVLQWYTTHDSGSLPTEDTPQAMAEAVLKELELWRTNQRNPKEIAEYWQTFFHADKALKNIFNI